MNQKPQKRPNWLPGHKKTVYGPALRDNTSFISFSFVVVDRGGWRIVAMGGREAGEILEVI